MNRIAVVALALIISGCVSQPPAPVLVVRVVDACKALETLPAPPVLSAWEVRERATYLMAAQADREVLINYVATVLEVLTACVRETSGTSQGGG